MAPPLAPVYQPPGEVPDSPGVADEEAHGTTTREAAQQLKQSSWERMEMEGAAAPTRRKRTRGGGPGGATELLALITKHGKVLALSVGATVGLLILVSALTGGQNGAANDSQLAQQILATSRKATAAGLVHPVKTSCKLVHSGGTDFILSVANPAVDAAKAARTSLPGAGDAGDAATTASTPPPTKPPGYDPFARGTRDARMVVMDVNPAHVLLLNRFPTLDGHSLLVTDEFESQIDALNVSDMRAWYRTVLSADAIGFFNSAAEAGASQRHKHMQLVPLASFAQCTDVLPPIDPVVTAAAAHAASAAAAAAAATGDTVHAHYPIFHLPVFKFRHAAVALPPPSVFTSHGGNIDAGEYILSRYTDILSAAGLLDDCGDDCVDAHGRLSPTAAVPPHNALLTARWMLVVPRSRPRCAGVTVNGMGFAGSLLLRPAADGSLPSAQPMDVLHCVTFSRAP